MSSNSRLGACAGGTLRIRQQSRRRPGRRSRRSAERPMALNAKTKPSVTWSALASAPCAIVGGERWHRSSTPQPRRRPAPRRRRPSDRVPMPSSTAPSTAITRGRRAASRWRKNFDQHPRRRHSTASPVLGQRLVASGARAFGRCTRAISALSKVPSASTRTLAVAGLCLPAYEAVHRWRGDDSCAS